MTLKLQARLQVVKHVGDSTREGEHDDKEGDEEHPDVLHHGVDTENDRAEVLGGDPNLDHLDDGQGEGDSPENPPRRADRRDAGPCSPHLPILLSLHPCVVAAHHVLEAADAEPREEEQVHHDVVVVPEREVALLEPSHFRTRSLKAPQEEGRSKVPEAVRGDEDAQQCVDDVDGGGGWLCDAGEDEGDEEDVGEGGVDPSVQGNPPLLAEPGRVVDTCPICWPAIDQELVPLNSFIYVFILMFIFCLFGILLLSHFTQETPLNLKINHQVVT